MPTILRIWCSMKLWPTTTSLTQRCPLISMMPGHLQQNKKGGWLGGCCGGLMPLPLLLNKRKPASMWKNCGLSAMNVELPAPSGRCSAGLT
jgi:hypothetical protein